MSVLSEAREILGVDQLVLAVHDRSLPAAVDEDLGCGAPGGSGAADFLEFAAAHGFTALQLGPAGAVTEGNLSPYDGTAFARCALQLAWGPLAKGELGPRLISERDLAAWTRARDPENRCDYPRAFAATTALLRTLHERWEALSHQGDLATLALDAKVGAFRADRSAWPEAASASERFWREQWLLQGQHLDFRARAARHGLALFADLQAGLACSDRASLEAHFLRNYVMGAPPSRTNPAGQPWGYPVPDPAAWGTLREPGPALQLWRSRFDQAFAEYDGLRVDHPHALVCPWVYRADEPDSLRAVRNGARLFSVGPAHAHTEVARLDIARPDQLAGAGIDAWADGWVQDLDEAQVERYSVVIDLLLERAKAAGVSPMRVVCEVLSTTPYPLARVLARHGLGRFRVTSKADVTDPRDVYLPANAHAEDWMMVGTHDTPPIWRLVEQWTADQTAARALHAASTLAPEEPARRARLASAMRGAPALLATAELAQLFACLARNVMIFVSDLLGETELYNRPGVVHADNWLVAVPSSFRRTYQERLQVGRALSVPLALALGLRSLPLVQRRAHAALSRSLAALCPPSPARALLD